MRKMRVLFFCLFFSALKDDKDAERLRFQWQGIPNKWSVHGVERIVHQHF